MSTISSLITELKTENFEKSYVDLIRDYAKYPDIYFNFSREPRDFSFKGQDILHREHDDPTGVYAYPSDFIGKNINTPVLGFNRKYLNILQDKSKNKLVIQRDWNFKTIDEAKSYLNEKFKHKMNIIPIFLNKYTNYEKENDIVSMHRAIWDSITFINDDYRLSPAHQTMVFIKAGYDAIEDLNEDSGCGVIYPDGNEPQVIFFQRNSFRLINTIKNPKHLFLDDKKIERYQRFLLYKISSLLNLGLPKSITRSNAQYEEIFTTLLAEYKNGITIEIRFFRKNEGHGSSSSMNEIKNLTTKISITTQDPKIKFNGEYSKSTDIDEILWDIKLNFIDKENNNLKLETNK